MNQWDFDSIIDRLKSFQLPPIDLIVGVESGGIVPAALIAYKLGLPLHLVSINFRDVNNEPQHREPVLLKPFPPLTGVKRILLVDDVAVSGKTLTLAKGLLAAYAVKTFVLKGEADFVLFPEIAGCVNWPWKNLRNE
jgi:uncharacterized protein